jgi:putative DNA primase/helicase
VGKRFVNISEPDKKLVLSAALVKTLTGNDTINARFLNENSFEFKPDFKLYINTNHLPQVTDVTLFTSGRVKVIPFERHDEEEEQDKGLKGELAKQENLSGILNWCIEGLWALEEEGFDPPDSVIAATGDYQQRSDKIGRFVAEELEEGGLFEMRTAEVYERYRSWCFENGFHPENAANFKQSIWRIEREKAYEQKWTQRIEEFAKG